MNFHKTIEQVTQKLLRSIKSLFPDFKSFTDPRFIENEITYKQRIIKDAQEALSKEKLQRLLDSEDYENFYNEVLKIGRHTDNNLLYRGTPSTGDLALLRDESLDKQEFAKAFFELLHGNGTGAERLDGFCDWVDEQDLKNKWTFVTYYLYVTNPDEELFVKPTETKKFLEMLGKGDLWHHRPTGELYQTIKDNLKAVGEALPFEVKRGFLDLQSFLWSALSAESDQFGKARAYLEKFSEAADTHFSENSDFLEPRYRYFQKFFDKENLSQADWSDFQEMGEKVHALATNALAYKRAFGNPNHDIEHYRKTFLYLAEGDDPLSERIDAVLDKESDYYLKYLAKSFYAELVGYLFPEEYVFYNRRDEEALAFLELDISSERGETFGEFFVRYNKEIRPLIDLYKNIVGQRTQTTFPLELDQFFSWLYDNHIEQVKDIDTEEIDEMGNKKSLEREYWLFSPGRGARYWDEFYEKGIMAIGWDYLGDLRKYESKPEIQRQHQKHQETESSKTNDTTACWEFVSGLNIGDVVIAKSGQSELLGYGLIVSDYQYDATRDHFKHVRKVDWKLKDNWGVDYNLVLKTLTNITSYPTEHPDYEYYHERLLGEMGVLVQDLDPVTSDPDSGIHYWEPYTMDDALNQVFMEEKELQKILHLLKYKKNIILQGPPGTGKTFLAERLAWLMMKCKDNWRIKTIQFHPSYSYEDFIRGYRPSEASFELKNGIFMRLCEMAKSDPDNDYFLIIDEINRGNLSKIFGELMMLIEKDKRGTDFRLKLPYQKKNEPDFYIPENLYLIGTMNTADRSLAMVDYALRRRFVFIDMMPSFGPKFEVHLEEEGVKDDLIDKIVERFESLNETISEETGLGQGFQIGHSYFCHPDGNADEEWYKRVIRYEIIPLLNEYWFDKTDKVKEIEEELITI